MMIERYDTNTAEKETKGLVVVRWKQLVRSFEPVQARMLVFLSTRHTVVYCSLYNGMEWVKLICQIYQTLKRLLMNAVCFMSTRVCYFAFHSVRLYNLACPPLSLS